MAFIVFSTNFLILVLNISLVKLDCPRSSKPGGYAGPMSKKEISCDLEVIFYKSYRPKIVYSH
jgi:hypothetical protein